MRLQTLASMSDVEIPFVALHDQINSSVDVIVQLTRFADGARRITEIALLASHGGEPYRLATVARFNAQPMTADGRIYGAFEYYPSTPHRRAPLHGEPAGPAGLRRGPHRGTTRDQGGQMTGLVEARKQPPRQKP